MSAPDSLQAAIAVHRFGLSGNQTTVASADPQGWLLSQIGPADPQRGEQLSTAADGLRSHAKFLMEQRNRRVVAPNSGVMDGSTDMNAAATASGDARTDSRTDGRAIELQFADYFRDIVQADLQARVRTAVGTQRPFAERLALFWTNHFTVSMAKASARGLAGAFEREAIRPHIAGSFENLLQHAATHAGMLRYLDNFLSAGPHSRFVERQARRARDDPQRGPRITGLNENLAREILELHTLGVAGGGGVYGPWGGYTQTDVTSFAAVLTGWRVPAVPRNNEAVMFDAAWHEPGDKQVLGKTYHAGADGLHAVLRDLARHPSTARFVSTKLARHFVADDPPPVLVERLVRTWRRSDGDLPTLYRELVTAPEAWAAQPAKLKTPEEFVISSARVLGLKEQDVTRQFVGGVNLMGQRLQAAPSPAGWPDRAEDWLGPDALWKRVEWSTRVADRIARTVDARMLARSSFGPLLSDATAMQIERAADGSQALALLLMSPEFQRR